MKSALIVTSLISHPERIRKDLIEAPYDMIICCDAGLDRAFELGIVPDIIIGDFDSAEKMQIVIPDDDAAQCGRRRLLSAAGGGREKKHPERRHHGLHL